MILSGIACDQCGTQVIAATAGSARKKAKGTWWKLGLQMVENQRPYDFCTHECEWRYLGFGQGKETPYDDPAEAEAKRS